MTSFSGRTHKSGSCTRRPFTFNRPARIVLRASARDASPKRESTRSSVIVVLGVGLLESECEKADSQDHDDAGSRALTLWTGIVVLGVGLLESECGIAFIV